MEANEIMTGDYFKIAQTGKIIKIVAVDEPSGSVDYFDGDAGGVLTIGVEKIEPISLTAEILEKNGFEKYLLSDSLSQRFEVKEGYTLKVDQFDIRVINDELTIYGPNNKYYFIPIRCNVLILYVHELQHIFKDCKIGKKIEL